MQTKKAGQGCAVLIVILVIIGVIAANSGPNDKRTTPGGLTSAPGTGTSCSDDWTKCKDNSDVVEHYGGWIEAKAACKMAAEKEAKYGTPTWPWLSFGSYVPGDAYVKTGRAMLIEPDAQFENGFGAKLHVSVMCAYDLGASKVEAVTVGQPE